MRQLDSLEIVLTPETKLLLSVIVALLAAFLVNRVISYITPKVAALIAEKARNREERFLQTRRAETFLSVGTALVRTLVVTFALFLAWQYSSPGHTPIALIGAGTFFIVLGSVTIGPLLRDITAGIVMIAEQWYNIGDHIVVEPFIDLAGVVEEMSLRSTKLRSLSGEVIWLHNQHIMGVRMTPRGVRTISIDTFVQDLKAGRILMQRLMNMMPTGDTMVASPMEIVEEEELGSVWRISVMGQTAPERNWLIEEFAVDALKKLDVDGAANPTIVYGPIVRYTDPTAERRFKRSMRAKKKQPTT